MSKFGAGDLNERITFLVATKVDDGLRTINTFATGDTVSANVKWLSDNARWYADSLQQSVSIRFVVRTKDIKHDWRIRYKGVDYAINGFKPIDKAFIEITCGEVAKNGS